MSNKKFLTYWDSVWQFLEDLLGCIAVFAMIPLGMLFALVFQ
jgi:hypothetical protein